MTLTVIKWNHEKEDTETIRYKNVEKVEVFKLWESLAVSFTTGKKPIIIKVDKDIERILLDGEIIKDFKEE